MTVGRILLVDADYDVLGTLARTFRDRGHHVVLATDGRTGLQRAVDVAPDVVLLDRDVPGVDARTFIDVLRDNPRTSGAALFVMGEGDPSRVGFDGRAEPIVKPLSADEVAVRVEDVLRARLGPPKEPELRGELQQVSLADLFQVFAANRRTGRLRVEGPSAIGEIWFREGRIVDATFGGVTGEKALLRTLRIARGVFVFSPNLESGHDRIDAGADQLLLEGARQADEIARLMEDLPPLDAQIVLASRPPECSATASEIVRALDEPRTLEDLLDVVSASDLAVLEAFMELIGEGALIVFDPRGQRVRIASDEDATAFRAATTRLRRPGVDGTARVGVICPTFADAMRLSRALQSVDEFAAASSAPSPAGAGAVGLLGVIRFEGTELELVAIPDDERLRPLWGPLLATVRVAIALSDLDDRARALLDNAEVRVVDAHPGWDRPEGAADTIIALFSDPSREIDTVMLEP